MSFGENDDIEPATATGPVAAASRALDPHAARDTIEAIRNLDPAVTRGRTT
jgi:hypothetical protein